MTLQQLRCVLAVADSGFGVSRAAGLLHTTQSNVSKTIRALEQELGFDVFARRGNRLVGLTDTGRDALVLIRRAFQDMKSLGALAEKKESGDSGNLRVGTTQVHARYGLRGVLQRFARDYPAVDLDIIQGTSSEILAWVAEGVIDIGLCTLPARVPDGVVALKAYPIERCLIVPRGHPLLKVKPLTVEAIARYPLVRHDESFNTGSIVQREFQRRGLTPRIALKATDASVIKAYVESGLGVAVLQKLAIEPSRDRGLRVIPADHLFPSSIAMLTLRRDHFMRRYTYDFIRRVAPAWSRAAVDEAMAR
jgi:LysR family cys regulon transcriptional activator